MNEDETLNIFKRFYISILNSVNGNIELDKNVNLGIGQFCTNSFSLNDTIILSFQR